MIKTIVLLLTTIFTALTLQAQTNSDSALQFAGHDTIAPKEHPHNALTTLSLAAGYAGATYLCYRVADDDVQRFSQRNQTKTLSFVARNYESIGMGESSIIITGATAIAA